MNERALIARSGPGKAWSRGLLGATVLIAVTVVVSVLLGLLSWHFWVLGLFGLVVGGALGWTSVVLASWLSLDRRSLKRFDMMLILLGFVVFQAFDDAHQRRAFREVLFETRSASSGLAPAEITRIREVSGLDFLARDADNLLESEVAIATGITGPIGRYVFRLQAGVRLGGPYRGGRGLDFGWVGGVFAALIELGLAAVLVARALRGPEPTEPLVTTVSGQSPVQRGSGPNADPHA
jgi:hypothetical protein